MDIESKLNRIEDIYTHNPHQFSTLKGIIEYETFHNIHNTLDKNSGSRTILRLVRALEFIISLMIQLSKNLELIDATRVVS